jgi:sodium transport system permease protein
MMRDAWLVYLKELTDALRDRRTLLMVLLSSVAIGPLVLVLVSSLVAGMEKRAEAREVVVQGLQHAPSLRNYLLRQTYTVREAPADHEQQLKDSKLGHPVLVVPETFEADMARGVAPVVELVSSAANQRAQRAPARSCGCSGASTRSRPPCDWLCAGCRRPRWRRCASRSAIWPTRPRAPPNFQPWCPFSC